MKLGKAIEVIEQRITSPHLPWNAEDFRALRISIEAMKRENKRRGFAVPDKVDLLPGETPEDDS